jgi:hypothetical protein
MEKEKVAEKGGGRSAAYCFSRRKSPEQGS